MLPVRVHQMTINVSYIDFDIEFHYLNTDIDKENHVYSVLM